MANSSILAAAFPFEDMGVDVERVLDGLAEEAMADMICFFCGRDLVEQW